MMLITVFSLEGGGGVGVYTMATKKSRACKCYKGFSRNVLAKFAIV